MNRRALAVFALAPFAFAPIAWASSTSPERPASHLGPPPTSLPPCPSAPSVTGELSVEWPRLLAWKRRVPIALDASFAEGFLELWVSDQYVGSVDPRDGDDRITFAPFWVRADVGDDDVPIRFRYGSNDPALPYRSGGNCYREAARSVPAAEGALLPYRVRFARRDDLVEFVTRQTYLSPSGCAPYAVVPAEFQVRTIGRPGRLIIPDQCSDRHEPHVRGKGWSATTFNFDGFQQAFWLRLNRYASLPRQRLRVRLVVGGRLLIQRTILVRRHRTDGYRIWEGTDAFVNVCINQGRVIRSSGGRLYCSIPATYSMSVRISA